MSESLNLVSEFIRNRRAIYPKNFKSGKSVEQSLIRQLIENANFAPTHKRTEPWRFVVIRGESKSKFTAWMEEDYRKQTGDRFSEMGFQKFIEKPLLAPCVIALVMQRHEESGLPEWEEVAAVTCAAQNFWLSASAAGLATYWSSPSAIQRVGSFLQLGDGQRCLGFFYLGYPEDDFQPAPSVRGDYEEKIVWMD